MQAIIINRPRLQDQPVINRLFEVSITDAFEQEEVGEQQEELAQDILEKQQYLMEDLTTAGKNRFFLIAWHQEEIVGTIGWGPANQDIVRGSKGALKHVPEIGGVYILHAYQRQGIGRRLLTAMLQALEQRGIQEFSLDCGFEAAQRAWKNLLGKPEYQLKDYWGAGADHMIWHCRVEECLSEFKKKEWIN